MAFVTKELARKIRHASIRRKVQGSSVRPRLCVRKSLKHIYVQIVDDSTGTSLVQLGSNTKDFKKSGKKSYRNIETAKQIGALIAEHALKKNIKTVAFDRGGYRYHGCVKALAEAAREGGLEF